MAQSAQKKVRRLRRALKDGRPVNIRLGEPWSDNAKYGYVLALTDEWVVVHTVIHGFWLDDVALFRLVDIKSAKRHPSEEFLDRVVAGLEVPIATFDAARDATLSELLQTISERTHLVMFYRQLEPGWVRSEVGTIRRVGPERLDLHAIDGEGEWAEESGFRAVGTIERVEFGGRYLEALERFGDPTPEYDPASGIADIDLGSPSQ